MKTPTTLAVALLALVVAACGGASDEVGGEQRAPKAAGGGGRRRSSRSSPTPCPKVGFDKVIPAFKKTAAGKGVTFSQSYGASGDQSRKVEAGLPTDVVNFSRRARRHPPREVRPGRRRLERRRAQGHPVRLGRHDRRPARATRRASTTWDDLLKPGVEVVTPEPVHLGLGEVEPARAVRRQERRRQGPAGRPRLPLQADRRPRQGPAEVRPRGDRDVPAGHRRRAAHLRERGAVRRAQRRGRRARTRPPTTFKIENPVAVAQHDQAPGAGAGVRGLPLHARGPDGVGRGRLPPGRPDRRARSSPPTSRRRRSSGRSTTSAAGARSTTSSSTRTTAPWPRSTTRPRASARWRPLARPKPRRRRGADAPAAASGRSGSASPRCG